MLQNFLACCNARFYTKDKPNKKTLFNITNRAKNVALMEKCYKEINNSFSRNDLAKITYKFNMTTLKQ